MVLIEPDNIKGIVADESVNAAAFICADTKLPSRICPEVFI